MKTSTSTTKNEIEIIEKRIEFIRNKIKTRIDSFEIVKEQDEFFLLKGKAIDGMIYSAKMNKKTNEIIIDVNSGEWK